MYLLRPGKRSFEERDASSIYGKQDDKTRDRGFSAYKHLSHCRKSLGSRSGNHFKTVLRAVESFLFVYSIDTYADISLFPGCQDTYAK